MVSRLNDADYQLRWPRWLFVQEASRLLNNRGRRNWDEVCEQFLEDAFVGGMSGGPLSEFREIQNLPDPWGAGSHATTRAGTGSRLTEQQNFLRQLLQSADQLKEDSSHRKPYWSRRTNGAPAQPARQAATARQFVALVRELDDRGYFEKRFGKDCVDDPSEVDPSAVIEQEIDVGELWPLQRSAMPARPGLGQRQPPLTWIEPCASQLRLRGLIRVGWCTSSALWGSARPGI